MGQKVHPRAFRIGTLYGWNSKWFGRRNFPELLKQDIGIRKFLKKELKDAAVARVEIDRSANSITITIHTAKPGIIIGRGGQGVEELKKKIKREFIKDKTALSLNIQEVANPNLSAELVVQSMIADLEKRMPFRRVLKQSLGRVERTEAKGVKVTVAGRLNGAEIARTESLSSGSLPLHTLRADIDYSRGVARTTYGAIGVKVWIYKGEKFGIEEEKKETKNPLETVKPKFPRKTTEGSDNK
ncbi:MAG: 30S ribosomal protein S3 [Candidatus Buchananbacteria bacterium RIFCSPHIGHO2_01_FULL_47_11b]|uniref:Small ribosomal subunit protein uS3 n=1 Tax=Candidatus Buchananbacteria bacterium RIFCSPHIGHO2_01_FULL_47_11b TaxID=1797537 RepID=A0A1G1Y456_9BACT|nr:MAG: 30S ribosomal protein S3 [Candidatus Buchananbacteria bacterium RIFCSPHIGHO2_01_FULL_47_11b]